MSALDGDIFTFLPDGAGVQRVTTGPALDQRPAWSPDGSSIAFERWLVFPSPSDIYLVSDGVEVNLTESPSVTDRQPAWSPDGSRIAFSNNERDVNYFDLYVMNADGSNVVRLTSNPGSETSPTWSPDGRWIAYEEREQGDIPQARDADISSLHLVTPDGSRSKRLFTPDEGVVEYPDWSPDGKKLAFSIQPPTETSQIESVADVWVVNVAGSGLKKLTTNANDDFAPVWSPNGQKILYITKPLDEDSYYLYRMNPDGTGSKRVLDIALTAGTSPPSWGPRP